MVAVMEEPAVMDKPCMRKTRTREAATYEPDAAACETHAADTHAAAHATNTHTAAHAADMHSASVHPHPPMHAATMAATKPATASEHG
jgi:hypothetical protein